MKIIIEYKDNKFTGNYQYVKDENNIKSIFKDYIIVDEKDIDLSKLNYYTYKDNKYELDNNLINENKIKEQNNLKETIVNVVENYKNIYINKDIEITLNIGGNQEKVTFINNKDSRLDLITKLRFSEVLGTSTVQVKFKNSQGKVIFIKLDNDNVKLIITQINDLIESAEIIETTVLEGVYNRYTYEQLKSLNVADFFQ